MAHADTAVDTAAVGRRLAGKVAVITGAASGIGRGAAQRFVAEGASVLVADISSERAQQTCDELGARAAPCTVDVSDAESVTAMVDAAVQRFGALDVMFSNAGVAESVKPLAQIDGAEWDRVMDVNLKGFFLCAQAAAPVMRAAGGGSIIVTGSIAARRPRPGLAAYVASKSGVAGLARALALELAADRIRVNVINPGPAQTPMLQEFAFGDSEEEALSRLRATLPLGNAIQPDDIAAAAVYLAGDESANVTGLVMNVDGGRDL
ncbi:MAG TPA: SDR family oxidoreductase [Solirubrobacteraceae bacterium]|jgi:3-oxoacyl-[acyl-carrier protein] reductase|nr:SDR family oxidoreductase [Solirubrobacteraceae bacterium]